MDFGNDQKILASVIVLVLELTSGMFLNVFILVIIFYDFYKQKRMSNSNKIVCGLGISNVIYNLLMSAGLLDEFVGLRGSSAVDLSPMYHLLLLYSVGSCAWLTASLGGFYFVKISEAKLLSWIKFHLRSIVPWMLLVLEVVSLINSFISSLLFRSPLTSSGNITQAPPSVLRALAEDRAGLINAVLAVTSIPLAVAMLSTLCTIWTLRRHSHKMERSRRTVDNGHLRSYMQVVCRITHFLLFYGIFYALMVISYFTIVAQFALGLWITPMLMSCFTPVQSVLLILGNPRLKEAWKEMILYRAGC
ncbi:hypothetical protein GDO81_029445 [Engystomops pustulosus]|uniref:Taste receptor type 2 n=1 Tax=Engystomops pustulosus TaxID=76066 RepID=A0AAV6YC13_ENGPU|nr:hypothetical protein GDO81_029445 [Engystomops pustulosus]